MFDGIPFKAIKMVQKKKLSQEFLGVSSQFSMPSSIAMCPIGPRKKLHAAHAFAVIRTLPR